MKRILAVEDDITQRYVLKIVLESFALDFEIAASAEEALKLLFEQKKQFVLILMDVKLTGMNGLDCTREIRRREVLDNLYRTRILALTAYASPEDRRLCLESGMDDYLSKPYTLDALKTLIDRFLEVACSEESVQHHSTQFEEPAH